MPRVSRAYSWRRHPKWHHKPPGLWFDYGGAWGYWCREELPGKFRAHQEVYSVVLPKGVLRTTEVRLARTLGLGPGKTLDLASWRPLASTHTGVALPSLEPTLLGWFGSWSVPSGVVWGGGARLQLYATRVSGDEWRLE